MEPVEGKVAGILNERELIINRGAEDGVLVGMRFAILNRNGVNVRDPDTDEILGSVDIVKTLVKIVRVDGDHLSVGRTFRTIRGRPGVNQVNYLSALIGGVPDRVETLKTQEASIRTELEEADSYVKIGDPAKQADGDEFDDA